MTTFHDGFSSASLDPPDYEPVASVFYGLRAFLIDDGRHRGSGVDAGISGVPPNGGQVGFPRRGALRSIFRERYVWGPGVNEAECLRMVPWGSPPIKRPHTTVLKECDCGFWAYTWGKHVVQVNGFAAFGVIEAGGRMVIGPHGFRAQHARIVGLCYDTTNNAHVRVGLGAGFAKLMQALPGPLAAQITTRGPINIQPPPTFRVTPELAETSRAHYPNVPVYETVYDLLDAHPLSDLTSLLPPEQEETA